LSLHGHTSCSKEASDKKKKEAQLQELFGEPQSLLDATLLFEKKEE